MSESKSRIRRLQAGIALVALGTVLTSVALAYPMHQQATSMVIPTTAAISPQNVTSSARSTFKDGSYQALGSYNSPGGMETISLSIMLSNDTVVATSALSGANDPTASSYQSLFISNYKQYVVGKKLNVIKLHNVSGSSLTSQGFNNALKQIENKARA